MGFAGVEVVGVGLGGVGGVEAIGLSEACGAAEGLDSGVFFWAEVSRFAKGAVDGFFGTSEGDGEGALGDGALVVTGFGAVGPGVEDFAFLGGEGVEAGADAFGEGVGSVSQGFDGGAFVLADGVWGGGAEALGSAGVGGVGGPAPEGAVEGFGIV